MPSEPYSKHPTPTNPPKKKDRIILLSPSAPGLFWPKLGTKSKVRMKPVNMKQRGDQTSNLSYKLYELISSFIIFKKKKVPSFCSLYIHGYNQLVGMRQGLQGQTRAQRQGDFKDVGAEL
jgi:hypothetical protein